MLSEKQAAFIQDPSRFKLSRSGRRAGKSFCGATYMILEALSNPSTPVLYIGLTRESAKEAVWGTLITILDTLSIPHEARQSALKISFPNGSFIRLFGADTPNAKDRLRGQKFRLICIDECGFYQGMDAIIPALLPMLADYAGTLAMLSSPGVLLSGFFYEADVGKNKGDWSQHSWNMSDNKFFQGPANNPKYGTRAEEELTTICNIMFNGDRQRPAFVREYMGLWVRDNSALVYPFTDANLIPSPNPLPKEQYGLGVDIGVTSASAIAVLKYSEYSNEVQIVETWSESEVLIDDFADILKDYMEKYSTSLIVADTGGLGAAVVQELRKRYDLPVRAAEKTNKSLHQRVFANDLLNCRIKCVDSLNIIKEWSKIIRDDITGEEVKGQPNHEADAALYIYRYIYSTYLKNFAEPVSDEDIMMHQLTQQALHEKREMDEARDDFY